MCVRRRGVCDGVQLRGGCMVCVLCLVAFVLYRDPFLILWWPQEPVKERARVDGVPLNGAADSVDDMFLGCRSKAANMVRLFAIMEWHARMNWTRAWALDEDRTGPPTHWGLSADHAAALRLYADRRRHRPLQEEFDAAVRTGRRWYGTLGFGHHFFYFQLVDAVRVLRQNQAQCRDAFLRTGTRFRRRNLVGKKMRFGAFVLASLSADPKDSAASTAAASCFEIYACMGAEVPRFLAGRGGERTLLLPPYEVFIITEVLEGQPGGCGAVYTLRSSEVPRSALNCSLDLSGLVALFVALASRWEPGHVAAGSCVVLLVVWAAVLLVARLSDPVVALLSGVMLLLLLLFGLLCWVGAW